MDKFTALADPTRRRIIEMLSRQELSAGEIAEEFQCSAPAVSQHLKQLKQVGLVRVRRQAQRRIYSLDSEGIKELDRWFAGVRNFWNSRLDSLEQALLSDDDNEVMQDE